MESVFKSLAGACRFMVHTLMKPDYFQFILGFVSIAAGALAGIGLAMALIAAQRSPVPPSPVDPVEIKRTENMSCTSLC